MNKRSEINKEVQTIVDKIDVMFSLNNNTTHDSIVECIKEVYGSKYKEDIKSPDEVWYFIAKDSILIAEILNDKGIHIRLTDYFPVNLMLLNYLSETSGKEPVYLKIEKKENCKFVEGFGSLETYYLDEDKFGLRVIVKTIGSSSYFSVLKGDANKNGFRQFYSHTFKSLNPIEKKLLTSKLYKDACNLYEKFKNIPSPAEVSIYDYFKEDGWNVWSAGGGVVIMEKGIDDKEHNNIAVQISSEYIIVFKSLEDPSKHASYQELIGSEEEYRSGDYDIILAGYDYESNVSKANLIEIFTEETSDYLINTFETFNNFDTPINLY